MHNDKKSFRIPKSWDDVNFLQWQKLIEILPAAPIEDKEEELKINLQRIAILLDEDLATIEAFNGIELIVMNGLLSWTIEPIKPKENNKIKIKDLSTIGYPEFVQFTKMVENNSSDTIGYISLFTDLKREELEKMPITEIEFFFVLLKKHMNRFLKRSAVSLIVMKIKQITKKVVQLLLYSTSRNRKHLTKLGAGL